MLESSMLTISMSLDVYTLLIMITVIYVIFLLKYGVFSKRKRKITPVRDGNEYSADDELVLPENADDNTTSEAKKPRYISLPDLNAGDIEGHISRIERLQRELEALESFTNGRRDYHCAEDIKVADRFGSLKWSMMGHSHVYHGDTSELLHRPDGSFPRSRYRGLSSASSTQSLCSLANSEDKLIMSPARDSTFPPRVKPKLRRRKRHNQGRLRPTASEPDIDTNLAWDTHKSQSDLHSSEVVNGRVAYDDIDIDSGSDQDESQYSSGEESSDFLEDDICHLTLKSSRKKRLTSDRVGGEQRVSEASGVAKQSEALQVLSELLHIDGLVSCCSNESETPSDDIEPIIQATNNAVSSDQQRMKQLLDRWTFTCDSEISTKYMGGATEHYQLVDVSSLEITEPEMPEINLTCVVTSSEACTEGNTNNSNYPDTTPIIHDPDTRELVDDEVMSHTTAGKSPVEVLEDGGAHGGVDTTMLAAVDTRMLTDEELEQLLDDCMNESDDVDLVETPSYFSLESFSSIPTSISIAHGNSDDEEEDLNNTIAKEDTHYEEGNRADHLNAYITGYEVSRCITPAFLHDQCAGVSSDNMGGATGYGNGAATVGLTEPRYDYPDESSRREGQTMTISVSMELRDFSSDCSEQNYGIASSDVLIKSEAESRRNTSQQSDNDGGFDDEEEKQEEEEKGIECPNNEKNDSCSDNNASNHGGSSCGELVDRGWSDHAGTDVIADDNDDVVDVNDDTPESARSDVDIDTTSDDTDTDTSSNSVSEINDDLQLACNDFCQMPSECPPDMGNYDFQVFDNGNEEVNGNQDDGIMQDTIKLPDVDPGSGDNDDSEAEYDRNCTTEEHGDGSISDCAIDQDNNDRVDTIGGDAEDEVVACVPSDSVNQGLMTDSDNEASGDDEDDDDDNTDSDAIVNIPHMADCTTDSYRHISELTTGESDNDDNMEDGEQGSNAGDATTLTEDIKAMDDSDLSSPIDDNDSHDTDVNDNQIQPNEEQTCSPVESESEHGEFEPTETAINDCPVSKTDAAEDDKESDIDVIEESDIDEDSLDGSHQHSDHIESTDIESQVIDTDLATELPSTLDHTLTVNTPLETVIPQMHVEYFTPSSEEVVDKTSDEPNPTYDNSHENTLLSPTTSRIPVLIKPPLRKRKHRTGSSTSAQSHHSDDDDEFCIDTDSDGEEDISLMHQIPHHLSQSLDIPGVDPPPNTPTRPSRIPIRSRTPSDSEDYFADTSFDDILLDGTEFFSGSDSWSDCDDFHLLESPTLYSPSSKPRLISQASMNSEALGVIEERYDEPDADTERLAKMLDEYLKVN